MHTSTMSFLLIFSTFTFFLQKVHGLSNPMIALVVAPLNSIMQDQVRNNSTKSHNMLISILTVHFVVINFKHVRWLFMKTGVCCCRSQDSCPFFRMFDLVGERNVLFLLYAEQ